MRHALSAFLAMLATQSIAACPAAGDMAKGVTLQTQTKRGEAAVHVFQATKPDTVTQTKQTHWITVSNTTRTWLAHGLLPTKSRLIKSTAKTPILKNADYSYSANPMALTLKPRSSFTITQTRRDYDGFAKRATLTYKLGAQRTQTVAGCKLKTIPITMVEDWTGSITTHKITYFTDLGFGFTTESKYPGKTFALKIKQISAQ